QGDALAAAARRQLFRRLSRACADRGVVASSACARAAVADRGAPLPSELRPGRRGRGPGGERLDGPRRDAGRGSRVDRPHHRPLHHDHARPAGPCPGRRGPEDPEPGDRKALRRLCHGGPARRGRAGRRPGAGGRYIAPHRLRGPVCAGTVAPMGEESGALPEEPHGLVQAAALGAASRARADAYLAEQIELTRLQIERERHDEKLRNWSQWVAHVSAVLKLAFEFVVALIVIVVGVALGAALWNAAHDDGLVIETFSVPPDLANRGLTGEVVAGKVLDRLTELQFQTDSNRAASSYVNNWGSDIKVQIPETGVSIGQLYRYLAGWLGHETHITGEIYRDDQGIAVTARVGGAPPTTVRGTDAELDRLIQQSAEAVYRTTQPYRYAVFLDTHGKSAQARAIYNQLVAGQSLDDRAWAYIGLSAQRTNVADFAGANALLHKAMAIKPDILLIYANLAGNESSLQHDEQQLAYARKTLELSEGGGRDTSMGANDARRIALQSRSGVAQAMGDLVEALSYNRAIAALPDENGTIESMRQNDATICAALHDRACFEAAVESFAPTTDVLTLPGRAANIQQADIFFEDWNDAIA